MEDTSDYVYIPVKKLITRPIISHSKDVQYSYEAKDLAKIYNFPAPDTTREVTVAVVSFGGSLYGTIDSNGFLTDGDVFKCWENQGLLNINKPTVIVQSFGNADINLLNSGTSENTLDVTAIGGCCYSNKLTIILCIFPQTYSWKEVFKTIVDGITVNGKTYYSKIISVSWGLSENKIYNSNATNLNDYLTSISSYGLNICCATGDHGSRDDTSSLTTTFPSCCPLVTAVGGTTLICPNKVYDASTTETVWNNGVNANGSFWATGGGVSIYYDKPNYQSNINGTKRMVPDISLVGDSNTGMIFMEDGKNYVVGGTSLSAPLFAAYLACISTKVPLNKFINPILYANPSCFNDITSGTNYAPTVADAFKYYTASNGYDCCSGLGSIKGGDLTTAIINYLNLTTPTINPSFQTSYTKYLGDSSFNLNFSTNSNGTITYTSSNPNLVIVDSSGQVTFQGVLNLTPVSQTVTITIVQSYTAVYSDYTTTVTITVSKNEPTITVSSIFNKLITDPQFNLNVSSNSGGIITYTNFNPNVVSINDTGNITIKSEGTATIRVDQEKNTFYNSTYKIVTIRVTNPNKIYINSMRILPNNFILRKNVKQNKKKQFKCIILPVNATNKSVVWYSSNSKIASINNKGLVTAKKFGKVIIKCKALDGSNIFSNSTLFIKNTKPKEFNHNSIKPKKLLMRFN